MADDLKLPATTPASMAIWRAAAAKEAATCTCGYPGCPWLTIVALVDEVTRLKAGKFTVEEIHGICHNLHGTVDAKGFADGCAAEQRKLYGVAPDRDALEALRRDKTDD